MRMSDAPTTEPCDGCGDPEPVPNDVDAVVEHLRD